MKNPLLPQITRGDLLQPSVLLLITANLVPLAGVFVFHWEVFPLLLLFWFENVIIGFFNALKMLCAKARNETGSLGKFFIIPFFCFHYGIFTFAHGVFVVVLFGGGMRASAGFPGPATFLHFVQEQHLTWAVLGLFVSHAVSFAHNFLIRGEFCHISAYALMAQPYGRIVVLHITIILGGMLMMALRSPAVGLALLVVLKIFLDLRGHLNERKKFDSKPKTGAQV